MGAIRWSIHAASKLANVPAVALSKWKSGALPIGSTYVRHLSALEAVLLTLPLSLNPSNHPPSLLP